jgi:hypothetical protein
MKNLGSILAAYLLGWAIFFGYFLTVAQRTSALREEMKRLRESLRRGQ